MNMKSNVVIARDLCAAYMSLVYYLRQIYESEQLQGTFPYFRLIFSKLLKHFP